MKKFAPVRALFVLLTLTVVAMPYAKAGDREVGSGGDGMEAQFIRSVADVAQTLLDKGITNIYGVDLASFRDTALSARVEFLDQVLYIEQNGTRLKRDAINYSRQNLITISLKTFPNLSLKEQERIRIHEVLGLMQIPDGGYTRSSAILEKYNSVKKVVSPHGTLVADKLVPESSGETVILSPRTVLGGREFPISIGGDGDLSPVLAGICRTFGFRTNAPRGRPDWWTQTSFGPLEGYQHQPFAFLNDDGSLAEIYQTPPWSGCTPVDWIRCK